MVPFSRSYRVSLFSLQVLIWALSIRIRSTWPLSSSSVIFPFSKAFISAFQATTWWRMELWTMISVPALNAIRAALTKGYCSATAPSEITTPSKPSFSRSRPRMMRAERLAGMSSPLSCSFGRAICPTMTLFAPSLTAWAKG
ncbi:hypothetical protein SDC9_188236 [bioreactor metagenome]|uniref:Uncharacterized protein n=1 Tax=bioreactor metagenome TaxID=1076179 RepID=A0A645HP21_9ZZZZ